jgi:pimeloyl-ACP methyl ester carboxylesterase
MPSVRLDEGLSLHCAVDDYLWPWDAATPVLMMHGFARNATFWNRWVPAVAESRRIYRPDLLGCGASDVPAPGYHFTPEKIEAEIRAVFEAMSLKRVHWVGESSGGIIGLLLAAAHPGRIASLGPVQHADADFRPHQGNLRARPGEHGGGDPGLWDRRMVSPNTRLPARHRACLRAVA